MKSKANKTVSGNGPKNLRFKGAKGKKIKKSKLRSKAERTHGTDGENTNVKKDKKHSSYKGGKNHNKNDNDTFKKKVKQSIKFKGKRNGNAYMINSDKKRKSEDDSGQVRKKLRVKKDDEVQPRLDKKDLKVARRKRKHNYELTESLIKKYDGLRR